MADKTRFDIAADYDSIDLPDSEDGFETKKDFQLSVREITNGYIITRTWKEKAPEGKQGDFGDGWCYKSEDEYVKDNPVHLKGK